MRHCYPELQKVLDRESPAAEIGQAVSVERERLKHLRPTKKAATERGRELQRETDTARVAANRIVARVTKKRIQSKEGEGGKPN